jgi:hypothetical protein
MRIQRVEALEAGICFMAWTFSEGNAFADDVRAFTSRLGLDWDEVKKFCKKDGGTLLLINEIEKKSFVFGKEVFAWFEVGRNTIFLSNMVGTAAPSSLMNTAMSGYRRYLEAAQIRVEERDRLQALLSSLQTGLITEKTRVLGSLRERLRDQAIEQETKGPTLLQARNNPWISGSFYLFVVVVVGAGLLAAAKILSPIALPFIVIGSILALSIVGALQLRNDGQFNDESFLKLMALSLKYLPLLRQRK